MRGYVKIFEISLESNQFFPVWKIYILLYTGTSRDSSFSLHWKSDESIKHYSLKCCLPSTDAIGRQQKIHACVWRFKVASCKCTSLKSTRFSQKKNKAGHFSNRVVYPYEETGFYSQAQSGGTLISARDLNSGNWLLPSFKNSKFFNGSVYNT